MKNNNIIRYWKDPTRKEVKQAPNLDRSGINCANKCWWWSLFGPKRNLGEALNTTQDIWNVKTSSRRRVLYLGSKTSCLHLNPSSASTIVDSIECEIWQSFEHSSNQWFTDYSGWIRLVVKRSEGESWWVWDDGSRVCEWNGGSKC